jgi:hypothetical protein
MSLTPRRSAHLAYNDRVPSGGFIPQEVFPLENLGSTIYETDASRIHILKVAIQLARRLISTERARRITNLSLQQEIHPPDSPSAPVADRFDPATTSESAEVYDFMDNWWRSQAMTICLKSRMEKGGVAFVINTQPTVINLKRSVHPVTA